jgi:hypothetical protein
VSRAPAPPAVTYCLVCGTVATTAGTCVGLAVSGTARIAAWSVTVVCLSALAGIAYGSAAVNALWERCRHLVRRADGV